MGRRHPTQNGRRAKAATRRRAAAPTASSRRKPVKHAQAADYTLLRTIIDAVPHSIYVKDAAGRYTLGNKAWREARGLTVSQVRGKTVFDLFDPALAAEMDAQDHIVLAGRPLVDVEHRTAQTDPATGAKTPGWTLNTKVPLRNAAGEVIGIVGISRNITEARRVEEAVRNERALLRTIVDALPDLIHVKDAQGRFRLGNRAWLDARRQKAEEIEGKTVFEIFPPVVAQRMDEQDRRIMSSGEPVLDQESAIYLFDGGAEQVWSVTSKVPMRDDAGNVVGIVGISRDITGRRRMERERAMEHGVARVLSESRSVKDTIPILIRTICEAMGWAYGARWAWDEGSGKLRRVEWWCDIEPQFDSADAPYWNGHAAPAAGGLRLLRNAWLEGRTTWVGDTAQAEFLRKPSCLKLGFRSAFAFPIVADDERLGVMEFFGREPREPDQAMLEVSRAISNQIGQFIRRKQAEEALQESEQQLSAMFDNADIGIAVTGLDMRYLRVNDRFCEIVGYAREELLRMRATDVNIESNVGEMHAQRKRMITGGVASRTIEKQLLRKDGSLVWVSLSTSIVRASDGTPRYFIAVIQDISESKGASEALKQSEEEFRRLAQYDNLTGLPNRSLFQDRLARAIAQARRDKTMLAVLFVDVDRFKQVNDTFGHAAGDNLLKQISQRLGACVRGNDTVGRLSGDEFAVVLSGLATPEDAATVAHKIVQEFDRPFHLEDAELFITSSVGITICPADGAEADALISNADVAMYRAKERGRNNYQFYMPEMNRRTREMLSMQAELRRALDRHELVLYYQPKVGLISRQVAGLEALLRWRHPERGLVPPGEFMTLLEESGLIVQAGVWVLRDVCRQLNDWQSAGVPLVPVAVNLSARQFLSGDLGSHIQSALVESRVAPGLLEVEITESSIMQDIAEATRTLEYLEALGVRSAIDDFGTGYSSLGYLKRFPLRALKVDRSFVSDITTNSDDATITQAVISMAHSLELKVVAEGVETAEQLEFLMRYGCDEVQGFLFSPPVPAEQCAAFIADPSRIATVIDSVAQTTEYVIPTRRT